jgi:MFS family permease
VLLYPVYALLFADAGLSTGAISSLFAIWSIVSFLAEVPSGALADRWSKRGLFAVGSVITASGYALWIIWPAYPGFVLGFVLWGLGGACASGTLEALVYDEWGSPDYARVMGRAGTAGILATLAATLLAAPAFAVGGYRLVGIASVAAVTLSGLLALRLPSASSRTPAEATESNEDSYAATLREGLRASVRNSRTIWAVLIAALVPGFTALDEYLPLLSREKGAPTAIVPLLYALTALAMAAGSALAGRFPTLPRRRLAALLAAATALMAAGALTRSVLGMAAVSAAFGILQFAMVLTETRLQETITGRARTTVLSISGFLSEVFAVGLYGLFALDAPLPALFALSALPLALTALATARYL